MKKYLLSAFILLSSLTYGQITVDSSDFAAANETPIYSNAAATTPGIDLSQTGTNFNWDFSTLQSISQEGDTFLSPASFGNIYSLIFINNAFNPNRSNLAIRGTFPTIPTVTLTDIYNFYYKSNTLYKQTGTGATLNGTQVPVTYTNPDIVYNFPMQFGDTGTSVSNFGVSIPGLGSYYGTQTRVNNVDGWGSLITPYGTFNCLRIVATLTGHDSVHVDSLGLGLGFDRPLTREYKWIAKGQDGPVLQINTQELFPGSETITAIRYRDSILVQNVSSIVKPDFTVYPNPANSVIIIRPEQAFGSNALIELHDISGRVVKQINPQAGESFIRLVVNDLETGLYSVAIHDSGSVITKKAIIYH